jgi:hypothetical protein
VFEHVPRIRLGWRLAQPPQGGQLAAALPASQGLAGPDLPVGIELQVHQNRLLKIAREGGQMTPADLAKFEPQWRCATLVALVIEGLATVNAIVSVNDIR